MEWWMGSALCLPATILAGIAGYLYGKNEGKKALLGTESGAAMVNINQQLAEIKGKFEAIEKSRLEREKMETRLQEEKDKGWKQLLDNTDKNEKGRLEQVQAMVQQMGQFQKLLTGTQSRGNTGEQVLKIYLKEQIKQKLVVTNANVGSNMVVEFAWKLDDGKYLPIDSKCHDILDLMTQINDTDDPKQQLDIKKKIVKKIDSSITEIKKYQNLERTTRYCVMAVPDAIFELVPEASSHATSENVLLTCYSNVALVAFLAAEQYNSDLEKGDVKQLGELIKGLLDIVSRIRNETETIEKGIKIVKNANERISTETNKANRIGG
ncbi:DNA recombination protein RmuC [Candidatus Micrarchaeota archaeon]|nr:DNA recombination protein RmuC [Candidatus Micrarchaeota archaeon]